MNEIFNQLEVHGSLLVGFNVLLQQLGLPIPAVPTMMIAGALTAMNRINGVATFALSVSAALFADLLWFWAGRRYGYPVLRFLCKVSLSPDTCVRQTEGIFQRWGFFSVVVAKFVPGFSTVGRRSPARSRCPWARSSLHHSPARRCGWARQWASGSSSRARSK